MAPGGLLDRLALVGCAFLVFLALAWIVLHPLVALFLQLVMVLLALAWRFGTNRQEADVHS
jgi:Flp pilus assembly protein TadB